MRADAGVEILCGSAIVSDLRTPSPLPHPGHPSHVRLTPLSLAMRPPHSPATFFPCTLTRHELGVALADSRHRPAPVAGAGAVNFVSQLSDGITKSSAKPAERPMTYNQCFSCLASRAGRLATYDCFVFIGQVYRVF